MATHKRLLSGLLSAALAAGITLTAAPALAVGANAGFDDVNPTEWYAEAVAFCRQRGLMNGVSETEFDPNGTMTRGMMATVLYRIEGEPEVTSANLFQDVDADSWYGPAVIWAAEQGLVEGYGNGTYGPMDEMTREQMTTILWRYDGSPLPDGTGPIFADESAISDWAAQAVDWAQENSVVYPLNPESFAPGEYAVRSALASALMNYTLYTEEPEPEPAPEPEPEPVDPWEDFQNMLGYRPQEGVIRPNLYNMEQFLVDETTGFMTYQGGLPYTVGIDVSSHQKDIDWQAVAASGVQFAIIRVGYRGYTAGTINRDPYFIQNIEGALAAGLKVGVYFFSQAVTVQEALDEAQYTIQQIRNYPITYPVVFDWERQDADTSRTKDTGEETITACAVAFCEAVKAAGYTPMFYGSPNKLYDLDLGYLYGYSCWVAHYRTDMKPTTYKHHFDIWQYTSSGSVPGIDGRVDMNICMRNDWNY